MANALIKLRGVEFRTVPIPLVRPFQFGMVELRELVHLRVVGTFEVKVPGKGSVEMVGSAGENLAPKWFEKNADTSLDDDVRVLRAAVNQVVQIGMDMPAEESVFRWWWELYRETERKMAEAAGLVRQLGVSLLERAAIDAWCRASGARFQTMLLSGALGFEPDVVDPAEKVVIEHWRDAIPVRPVRTLAVRHTVGLGDELGALRGQLGPIGIRRLKVKLSGDAARDVERIEQVTRVFPEAERLTLDGNENYASVAALAEFLGKVKDSAKLAGVRGRIAWVEQALNRQVALSDEVKRLRTAHPEFGHVIDESDDSVKALPRALAVGYVGTTHKACKGVFKSVLAAARLVGRKGAIFSAEDLTIVAPWSMTQDLAVAAAVSVVDIERNGHHYADGLSAFGPEISKAAVKGHPDLYELDSRGIACLKIRGGVIDVGSVNAAPFGWAGGTGGIP